MAGEAFGLGARPAAKAALAQVGLPMTPDMTARLVAPPKGQRSTVVILQRVVKNVTPEYCIHGYAQCVRCEQLCWLGSETHQLVADETACALCLECAQVVLPAPEAASELIRGHVDDHRRADGPHE